MRRKEVRRKTTKRTEPRPGSSSQRAVGDSLFSSSLDTDLLHLVLGFSEARRIAEDDLDAGDVERDGDDVTRRPGYGRDDSGVALGEVVEEGGLQKSRAEVKYAYNQRIRVRRDTTTFPAFGGPKIETFTPERIISPRRLSLRLDSILRMRLTTLARA
jgi:hypothetical protein